MHRDATPVEAYLEQLPADRRQAVEVDAVPLDLIGQMIAATPVDEHVAHATAARGSR